MKRIFAIMHSDKDSSEEGLVHYNGPGIIGSHTLCGHTDRIGWDWEETTKRVNCPGCVGTRDHVFNRT